MIPDLSSGAGYHEYRSYSEADISSYANLSGDHNPIHLDDKIAMEKGFKRRICHGMLVVSNISKILAVNFPGPGTIYLQQSIDFKSPAYPGEKLKYSLTVLGSDPVKRKYQIQTDVFHDDGEMVLTGEALVLVR